MAINPGSIYPGKTKAPDADYPFGSARNVTTPGDGTGTPWEAALVNDLFGFQQALMDSTGIVPTGTPEKVGASQYLDAILSLTVGRVEAAADLVEGRFDGQRVDLSDGTAAGTVSVQWDGASTATDDGKYVFQVSGVTTGRWLAVGAKAAGVGVFGALPAFQGFTVETPTGLSFSATKPVGLPAAAPTGAYVVFQLRSNHYFCARNGTDYALYYGVAVDATTAPPSWVDLAGGGGTGNAEELLAQRDIRYAKVGDDPRKTRGQYNFDFTNRRVLFEPDASDGQVGNMRPNLMVANSAFGKYHLYYNVDRSTGILVRPGDTDIEPFLATSNDLITWVDRGSIAAASGFTFAGVVDFNVHYDEGLQKFVQFSATNETAERKIRRSESTDGLAFASPSVAIDFAGEDVRYPSVLNFGGIMYLYYMVLVGANWQIRRALSLDGGFTWTLDPNNPMMTRISSLGYEDLHVFDPHPIIVDNMILMAYTSGGTGSPIAGETFTERLSVATSYDGLNYGRSNANPILSPTGVSGDPDEMWCIDANLFFEGDTLYVVYTGQSVDGGSPGIRRLMIAEADQS